MKTTTLTLINNELALGSYPLTSLAKVYGTPLYLYDEVQIRNKIATFIGNFQSSNFTTDIIYASKAFLAPYICDLMKAAGCGMDAVSLGDLHLMKKAAFPMEKVVLHGNNKSRDEHLFALKNKVGVVVVDHLEELIVLERLATEMKVVQPILIRINPGIEAHTHEYIQTSKMDSKFGESIFDEEKMTKIIRLCQGSTSLRLEGFHAHIGSNIHTPEAFIKEIEIILAFVRRVRDLTGFETTVLNLGGGFGIQYIEEDPQIDLAHLLQAMIKTLERFIEQLDLKIQKVMLEPGRSIVGDAGMTLYTVGATKQLVTGKKYVFVDGGMTDNIRPALYKAKYTVDVANRPGQTPTQIVDVVGKCCESGDIVATNIPMSEVKAGDTLVVYSTGAYGYSMSSNYNGALKAEVLFVRNDKIEVASHRESLDDLLHTTPLHSQRFCDIHSDMLYDLNQKALAGNHTHFPHFHVPQLITSAIKLGVWTMYSPDDFNLIEACRRAIDEIKMPLLPGFEVILGLEGLRNLEKVEDITPLHEMGFRHAMLTWNEENRYATGAKADPTHGLSEEGRRLVKAMEDKGWLVDLAHLNEKSFYEVLAITNKNIINSHGNVKRLCPHVRNLTDDQMRALRAADGLMGLTLANNFVAPREEDQTLDCFMDHLDAAVSIMDVDHVCFGFDFMDYLSEFPNSNLVEVDNATKVYRIAEAMRKRGYTDDQIDKICYRNFYHRYHHLITLRSHS